MHAVCSFLVVPGFLSSHRPFQSLSSLRSLSLGYPGETYAGSFAIL